TQIATKLASCSFMETVQLTVTLSRSPNFGLGIEISGGIDSRPMHPVAGIDEAPGGVYVCTVISGGPADKVLKPGDLLLGCNGSSMRRVTHDEAIAMLQRSPVVNLLIERTLNARASGIVGPGKPDFREDPVGGCTNGSCILDGKELQDFEVEVTFAVLSKETRKCQLAVVKTLASVNGVSVDQLASPAHLARLVDSAQSSTLRFKLANMGPLTLSKVGSQSAIQSNGSVTNEKQKQQQYPSHVSQKMEKEKSITLSNGMKESKYLQKLKGNHTNCLGADLVTGLEDYNNKGLSGEPGASSRLSDHLQTTKAGSYESRGAQLLIDSHDVRVQVQTAGQVDGQAVSRVHRAVSNGLNPNNYSDSKNTRNLNSAEPIRLRKFGTTSDPMELRQLPAEAEARNEVRQTTGLQPKLVLSSTAASLLQERPMTDKRLTETQQSKTEVGNGYGRQSDVQGGRKYDQSFVHRKIVKPTINLPESNLVVMEQSKWSSSVDQSRPLISQTSGVSSVREPKENQEIVTKPAHFPERQQQTNASNYFQDFSWPEKNSRSVNAEESRNTNNSRTLISQPLCGSSDAKKSNNLIKSGSNIVNRKDIQEFMDELLPPRQAEKATFYLGKPSSETWNLPSSFIEECQHFSSSRTRYSQLTDAPDSQPGEKTIRVVPDLDGSIGVRLDGGNAVGIFVRQVTPGGAADRAGIRPSHRLLAINEKSIARATKEEAMLLLLRANGQELQVRLIYDQAGYRAFVASQKPGENFFVRAHFTYSTPAPGETAFRRNSVFQVRDTLVGGVVGSWEAVRVHPLPAETEASLIPCANRADQIVMANAGSELPTAFPPYERVAQRRATFCRPVVIFGPFADRVRNYLVATHPDRFELPKHSGPTVKLSEIRSVVARGKHCVLDLNPVAVDRLCFAQLAPIVLYVRAANRMVVKKIRKERGSKRLYQDSCRMERWCSHLFTGGFTVDQPDLNPLLAGLDGLIHLQQCQTLWLAEKDERLIRALSEPSLCCSKSNKQDLELPIYSMISEKHDRNEWMTCVHHMEDQQFQQRYSPSGSCCSNDCPLSAHVGDPVKLRKQQPIALCTGLFDFAGGQLRCSRTGATLEVPPNALALGRLQRLQLAVLGAQTLLLGPPGVRFQKHLTVRLPAGWRSGRIVTGTLSESGEVTKWTELHWPLAAAKSSEGIVSYTGDTFAATGAA
ncbi:hypothetical protein BOX15_Mlig021440g1, partial [Macrostomum lignano]